DELLLAIARARRGRAPEDESLIRTLAADLDLDDPLALDPAEPWTGPRPDVLKSPSPALRQREGPIAERWEGEGRGGGPPSPGPRPPRRAADRAQFLFGRYPRRADGGGVAARLAFRVIAGRALRPGARLLPEASRLIGLGHRQHADRRRRHRPGHGIAGGPADL